MIAKEFPNNIAFMFALLETFFGVGMICGPTVGGALYELGGFTLPFATLGSKLLQLTGSSPHEAFRLDDKSPFLFYVNDSMASPLITVTAGVLVCAAILTSFILPNPGEPEENAENKPSMLQALKVPSIVMASYR